MKVKLFFYITVLCMASNMSIMASSEQDQSKGWFTVCSQSLVDATKSVYESITNAGSRVVNSIHSLGNSEVAPLDESKVDSSLYTRLANMLNAQACSIQKKMEAHIADLFEKQTQIMQAQYDQYLEKQKELYTHLHQKQEHVQQLVGHKIESGLLAFDERISGLIDSSVMLQIDEKQWDQASGDDLESTLKKHVDTRVGSLTKHYKNIEKKLGMISSTASAQEAQSQPVDMHTLDYINKRVRAALQKKMGRNI